MVAAIVPVEYGFVWHAPSTFVKTTMPDYNGLAFTTPSSLYLLSMSGSVSQPEIISLPSQFTGAIAVSSDRVFVAAPDSSVLCVSITSASTGSDTVQSLELFEVLRVDDSTTSKTRISDMLFSTADSSVWLSRGSRIYRQGTEGNISTKWLSGTAIYEVQRTAAFTNCDLRNEFPTCHLVGACRKRHQLHSSQRLKIPRRI